MQGGTRAAPPYFNDRNREEPANYWPSAANCTYLVTLREPQGSSRDGASGVIDTLGEREEAACTCSRVHAPCAGFLPCLGIPRSFLP